jgi:hypothetical protein
LKETKRPEFSPRYKDRKIADIKEDTIHVVAVGDHHESTQGRVAGAN